MSEDLSFRAKWFDDGVESGLNRLGKSESDVVNRSKEMRTAVSDAGRSFDLLANESEKLSASLQDQIFKLRAQRELLQDPVYAKSAREAAQLKREVDKLNEGIQSSVKSTENSTKAAEKHGITWSEVVSKYYLVSQAARFAGRAVMSLVDASAKYDQVRARFAAVEGSDALGARDLKEAQELAKRPGLGFEQVATTMATLRGMKVTAAETKSLIEGIGNANAAAAGTAEQFGRVMYQIQQSVSLGKLTQEDLKPIVQAIPTLGAAMQAHFGASQAEQLNAMMKKSGMSIREFWLEVAELGSNLPAAGETITNNLDNIGDAWDRFKASITDDSAVKWFTRNTAQILDRMAVFSEKMKEEGSKLKAARAELGLNEEDSDGFFSGILRTIKTQARISVGLDPESGMESGYQTSVGGVIGKQEAIARTAVTQNLRDALQERLQIRNEAESRELADKKRADEAKAAQDAKAAETEAERIRRHNLASEANVITNFDGSVTLRSGIEWETQDDTEHIRNRQRAEAAREKNEKDALAERVRRQKEYNQLLDDENKEYTKKLDEENKKRIESEKHYWNQVQSLATNAIDSITKTLITQEGSMESKLRSIMASGVSMLISSALAPASGGVSLAPAGVSLFNELSGVRRASGGQVLGGFIGNENSMGGAEYFQPNTPGRIYNSSQQTTNNIGGHTIYINAGGGDARSIAREVAKVLPRASNLSIANRSQTSRSGR